MAGVVHKIQILKLGKLYKCFIMLYSKIKLKKTHKIIYIYVAQDTRVQSQVKSYQILKKWYLISPCLTLSIIRYISRVKWNNPRKEVAPFPTPCSSYWKGNLWDALDYCCQLYLLYIPGYIKWKLINLFIYQPIYIFFPSISLTYHEKVKYSPYSHPITFDI